jgi:2-oxoglutarate dehydrogenase complex dehydrogenase (E1) component-like enzyme
LCDEDEIIPQKFNEEETLKEVNMLVVNCSTAANYFHLLRR